MNQRVKSAVHAIINVTVVWSSAGRVLWELNEAAGAIDNERRARHTPQEQWNFFYATVAGAASAFPVMSMR